MENVCTKRSLKEACGNTVIEIKHMQDI